MSLDHFWCRSCSGCHDEFGEEDREYGAERIQSWRYTFGEGSVLPLFSVLRVMGVRVPYYGIMYPDSGFRSAAMRGY
jgi:hypothetical protein